MARRMDIEQAVVWAYRDELPKDQARAALAPGAMPAAWQGISRYGELLTEVDCGSMNRWGVVPDLTATSAPNPDAVALHERVLALDDYDLGLPEGWDALADLGLGVDGAAACGRALERFCVTEADGRRRLRHAPAFLVRRAAILGAPVWAHETPMRREVTHPDGRSRWFQRVTISAGPGGHPYEIEVDGWCATKRRPHAAAYRKFVWDPDLAEIALDRAIYEVWRAALAVLADELAGVLESINVMPSLRPARPWETGETTPRVWRYDPPMAVTAPMRKKRRRAA
jgi:hypothetical protein